MQHAVNALGRDGCNSGRGTAGDTLPVRVPSEALETARNTVLLNREVSAMIEAIPDYVLILNEERQVLAANEPLVRNFDPFEVMSLLGARPGEALGCAHADEGNDGCGSGRHCTACGAAAAIRESSCQKRRVSRECTFSRKGHPEGAIDLLAVATPVRIGGLDLTVCVLKDISAEKRRSVLERVFFHDVINTAGGIRGIASLVAQGSLQDQAQDAEYRRWLLELSERLMDEIMHQRKLMAAEKGEFVPELGLVDLPGLLREVHALYVNHDVATGINLIIGTSPPGLIMSDGAILRRILGNLVKNALEATPAGGTVTISAVMEEGKITFSVRNPGVMAEKVQLQLFNRSFSTKEGSGRGIGTYSVKLFGEGYLKGKVSFVSNEAEGTAFHLTLPVVADKA
jgi:histidine kinase/DNA gyrase B/HSP90-like ATPase